MEADWVSLQEELRTRSPGDDYVGPWEETKLST